jgi:hypothetical protein
MSESPRSPHDQDFEAALHEVESNLDVRRLTFVLGNILVPAMVMAMSDAMAGTEYPPEIAWLPRNILWLVGGVLAIGGVLVSAILARCHFGLVVNGSKMRKVTTGAEEISPLNWLGVTTNFTALTALSSGAGLALTILAIAEPRIAVIAGAVLVVLLVLWLRATHWRANRLCRRLYPSWQQGAVRLSLREEHARKSLDATTADISVIVTMAAALFAGAFSAMTNIGGIPDSLELGLATRDLKAHGLAALSGYTLLSLLLSARMVVRLRIALGDHSATLARLRNEPDEPFAFRWTERTFLLFLVVELLAATCAVIFAWTLVDERAGRIFGGVVIVTGVIGYVLRLGWARGRDRKRSPPPLASTSAAEPPNSVPERAPPI